MAQQSAFFQQLGVLKVLGRVQFYWNSSVCSSSIFQIDAFSDQMLSNYSAELLEKENIEEMLLRAFNYLLW